MRDDEDPKHYAYMASVGTHAILEGLTEDEHTWGYGGPVRIRKTRPYFDIGRQIFPLHPGTHFYKRAFTTPDPKDASREVRGVSLWFEKYPRDPPVMGESITLCGWVPMDREAQLDEWIAFLNGKITERLAAAPVDESDRQMQGKLAWLESLGLQAPKGDTVEQVMSSLKEEAKKQQG
jgi:hypothetical protein